MKNFKIDNKGAGKLFSNRFLESLTRTHFLIPVTLYYLCSLIICFYVVWKDLLPVIDLFWLFPLGFMLFTFVEYMIHRFIFHFNVKNEKEEKLQYNIHGIHHEFPRDKFRLVMPPLISILIAFLFYFSFKIFFGNAGYLLFSGFCAGYSTYLLIHYFIHARKPPSNFLRYLWIHHSLHHYQSEEAAFSVSLPLWDYIFGTMPTKSKPVVSKKNDG
ncbi:MAG TPA: sterol desaturase family protein [Bacteroidia bacterium]|nr:sterol desaturase family protein [Bacteroidia bacterium]HNS12991.1 sterol desaturase family protein [Bacteroidia bacterium]